MQRCVFELKAARESYARSKSTLSQLVCEQILKDTVDTLDNKQYKSDDTETALQPLLDTMRSENSQAQ